MAVLMHLKMSQLFEKDAAKEFCSSKEPVRSQLQPKTDLYTTCFLICKTSAGSCYFKAHFVNICQTSIYKVSSTQK